MYQEKNFFSRLFFKSLGTWRRFLRWLLESMYYFYNKLWSYKDSLVWFYQLWWIVQKNPVTRLTSRSLKKVELKDKYQVYFL